MGRIVNQGACYALRVAPDCLMVEGKHYRTERDFIEGGIEIKSDEIAIPSTTERLNMPCHLVGKPGIRFDYASQCLTGQMGIQVDPFFVKGHDNERL